MEIRHFDIDEMMSAHTSKGPQGEKFRKLRNRIVDFESEELEQSLISKHSDAQIQEQTHVHMDTGCTHKNNE